MRIALMAVDSRHFNFALAKIASFHKEQGDSVEWYDPMFGSYDRLYMSKIFNFTPDYLGTLSNAAEVVKGGTGYSLSTVLPAEIESCLPDYSIYPDVDNRTSYGFLTRGCPNHCKWCVVPQKEGGVKPYADIDDVTENGRRPYAVLMDNNILACDYGLRQIEKIIDRKYHVDFNQALDARLVTDEIAKMLAQVKWIKVVRFGCDTPAQVGECERALDMMRQYGFRGQALMYCMIHGTLEECYARISHWKKFKNVRVVAQPFRNPTLPILPPPTMAKRPRKMGNAKGLLHGVRLQGLEPAQGFSMRTALRCLYGRRTWRIGRTSTRHTSRLNLKNFNRAKDSDAKNTLTN